MIWYSLWKLNQFIFAAETSRAGDTPCYSYYHVKCCFCSSGGRSIVGRLPAPARYHPLNIMLIRHTASWPSTACKPAGGHPGGLSAAINGPHNILVAAAGRMLHCTPDKTPTPVTALGDNGWGPVRRRLKTARQQETIGSKQSHETGRFHARILHMCAYHSAARARCLFAANTGAPPQAKIADARDVCRSRCRHKKQKNMKMTTGACFLSTPPCHTSYSVDHSSRFEGL